MKSYTLIIPVIMLMLVFPFLASDSSASAPRTLYGIVVTPGATYSQFEATFYSGVVAPNIKNYDLIGQTIDEPVNRWGRWITAVYTGITEDNCPKDIVGMNATLNYFADYFTTITPPIPPPLGDVKHVWAHVIAPQGYYLPEGGWISVRYMNETTEFYTNPDDYPNCYDWAVNYVADDGAGHKTWTTTLNQNNTAPPLFNFTTDMATPTLDGTGQVVAYQWNITGCMDWTIPMLTGKLWVVWNMGTSTAYKRIDYVGISYDFLYYDDYGDLFPEIPELENEGEIASVLILFLFFFPVLTIAYFIPDVGFIVGIIIFGAIYGFYYSGFFSTTLLCFVGGGALLIKHD